MTHLGSALDKIEELENALQAERKARMLAEKKLNMIASMLNKCRNHMYETVVEKFRYCLKYKED